MDDHQFDDYIKRKADQYEEQGFNPDALSRLHQRLSSVQEWPWYSRYRTELIVSSSVLLCTLVILWGQYHNRSEFFQITSDQSMIIKAQGEQISKLQEEITDLKTFQADTFRINRKEEAQTQLLLRIAALEKTIPSLKEGNSTVPTATLKNRDTWIEIPSPVHSNNDESHVQIQLNSPNDRIIPHVASHQSLRAKSRSEKEIFNESPKLSVKKLRDMERHYHHGIGIRLGPTLEFSKGIYSKGKSDPAITGGVLADFILSPSISVETGAKYTHRFYEISGNEKLAEMEFPGVDQNLGTLVNADIDSWMMEFPLNLKCRFPISRRAHWLAGLGYSSFLYTKQIFEYDYEFESGSPVTLSSSYTKTGIEVYPGTLNFSMGFSRELKNKKTLETSIYYQLGLGKMGVENADASFIGLRGVYWFTLR